jgi:uncharacterized protein YdgA (DUF945 family)
MNWLNKRSVATITASLTGMVEQLKAHAEAQGIEAEKHAKALTEATVERDSAQAIAAKIEGLLS